MTGNLLTTTMADYLVPSALDLPSPGDRLHADARDLATRWASRASARRARSPPRPAVVNAIVDALRPIGVRDITMPCTPAAGLAGHPAAARGGTAAGFDYGERNQTARRERAMIPAAFDYVKPQSPDEAVADAGRAPATTPRSSPAGRA